MRIFFSTLVVACLLLPSVAQAKGVEVRPTFWLDAVEGADGGFCVLKGDVDSEQVELVTAAGALSKRQLARGLRYMSYQAQTLNAAVSWVGLTVAGMVYPVIVYHNEQEDSDAVLIQTAAILGLGVGVEYWHRRDRVNTISDAEKKIYFYDNWRFATGAGDNRFFRLRNPFKPNSTRGLGVVKGEKMVERLQNQEPDFPGGCDHI